MAPPKSSDSGSAAPGSAPTGSGASGSPASASVVPVSLANAPVAPPDGLVQWPVIDAERVHAEMDEGPVRVVEGDDRYLHSSALVTCTGIAVSGVYPPLAPNSPSGPRYNRFMVHTTDLEWEEHYETLAGQVREALAIGLHDLQIYVVAAHPETYPKTQDELDDDYEDQRDLLARLRGLLGPEVDDGVARIHWYPYDQGSDDYYALIALYSDRGVLVNQKTFKAAAWELEEKHWPDPAELRIPMPTPPPADWKTRVNIPWYVNQQKKASGA
ncbi:hypothetical protein PG985_014287 [Apiospora marii]|uniref:uncharacterized protein n=1 Tax=Apiospora marii TaxID=335849 RepID=UPI0031315677